MFTNGGGLGNSVTLWKRLPNLDSKSVTKRLTAFELPKLGAALMPAGGVSGALARMDEWRWGGTGGAPLA